MRTLVGTIVGLCLAAGTMLGQFVEDSIDVGGAWVGSLAYNSREDVIYGGCEQAGIFFAISCDSNRVVSRQQLSGAFIFTYDSLDNKAYASYYGSSGDSLAVIDGATHRIIRRMEMPGATMPVWDPVSDRVYVSCQNAARVAVVDCRSDSLLTYIDVGWTPLKMYLNTLRRKLYVLNYDAGTVSVIDLVTNRVTRTIDVGDAPNAGYYCRRVDKFYCSSPPGGIAVIDGRADTVVARIPVAPHSDVFSISGNDGRNVVLASVYGGGSRLYAIDILTDVVDTVIHVGRATYAICLSQTSDRFYCTSALSDEVVVLSGDGMQHLATLPVSDAPFVIAESPVQKRLYVGHLNSSKVYVIRDADIPWPEGQHCVADTAAGLRLVPNPFRGRLSIVADTTIDAREVKVFSEDGQMVKSLTAARPAAGVQRIVWDGRDSRGRLLPAGVYVVTLTEAVRARVVKVK
jgi:YVTN family beta-propeller protein